jgi:hypothetical protein
MAARTKTIGEIFDEGWPIDNAVRTAVRRALRAQQALRAIQRPRNPRKYPMSRVLMLRQVLRSRGILGIGMGYAIGERALGTNCRRLRLRK